MNLSLEKTALLKIIQNAQRAISNKSTLPVLNGIFLKADNGLLSAYSTDLEISIKDSIESMVEKPGKVVVFGHILVDLIKNLDDGKVRLSLDEKENKLVVTSNKSNFNLNILPIEDYPPFPQSEETQEIQIENNQLHEAIRQVIISSSRDESRPVLTGVLLSIEEGRLVMVATDSYRLAVKEIKGIKSNISFSLIIPRRSVEEIIKTIPRDGQTQILFSDKQIALKSGNLTIISRLIGGQYPKYEQLLPQSFEAEIDVEKEKLLQSARRMALISPSTPVVIRVEGEKLNISNRSADVGSGEEEIDIKGKTKDIEVAFNSRYLIDGLSAISEENILLQLIDGFQPGLISGGQQKDYSYLIMPVRLN